MVINSSRINSKESIDWAIKKYLEDYNADVIAEVTKVVPEVAKEAVTKLKQTSPKDTGKYAKGWTMQVDKGRMNVGVVIYGKTGTYQLAHLLEHEHAKRNGGRSKPIEHIKPVEEWLNNEIIDRTIERLANI